MKKFLRFFLVVSVAVLVLMSITVAVSAADGLTSAEMAEYARFRLLVARDTYGYGAQNRIVSGEDFSYLLVYRSVGGSSTYVAIDNSFSVYAVDEANNNKVEMFSGITTYGAGDLLVDSNEKVYVVSGAASWVYYGPEEKEMAIVDVAIYNEETGVPTTVRSNCQYAFPAGSMYEYRSAFIDEAAGKIYAFFVSGDGLHISWMTYDIAAKVWVSIDHCAIEKAVDDLYVYSTASGAMWIVGQDEELTDGYFIAYASDKASASVTQKTESLGGQVDVVYAGDVYLDNDGKLHVIAYDAASATYSHITYTTLEDKTVSTLALSGNCSVQLGQLADGTWFLLSVTRDGTATPVEIYTASDASLSDLTLVNSFATASKKPLLAGSFQVAGGGSKLGNKITCSYSANDFIVGVINVQ